MVILHTESSMNFGGQELRICIEMEGLKKYGIESILACKPDSKILSIAQKRGLTYYEVPFNSSFCPFSITKLFKIIKKHKVNIVNSHNSKDAWNSAFICKLLRIPFVRSRHIALKPRKHFFGKMIYTLLADRVLVTGKYIEDMLIKNGVNPQKIYRVPTGVDISKFSGNRNGLLRKELGISDNNLLIGFVSVVRSDKGPHYFVRSIPYLLNYNKNLKFVIVGDGSFLNKTKAIADELNLRNFLYFTGHRDDIPSVMSDLDIFVLPAIKPEGIPQALLQAFASGVPVVASDIGGVNEVAIHNETAVLVKPREPEELAKAIINLVENKNLQRKIVEGGKKLVSSYTLDGMLLKMKAFYESMIKNEKD